MKFYAFFLSLFLVGLTCVGQAVPYGNNPAAGHYQSVRGIRLYYEVYGTGKPLLLIHGNGGSIENMKSTIPYFAKKYRVIAVDSRAHGKSIDQGDSLSFEMMADDFAALLTSLHVDSTKPRRIQSSGCPNSSSGTSGPRSAVAMVSTLRSGTAAPWSKGTNPFTGPTLVGPCWEPLMHRNAELDLLAWQRQI